MRYALSPMPDHLLKNPIECSWATGDGLQPATIYQGPAYQRLFAGYDGTEPRVVMCHTAHGTCWLPVLLRDLGGGAREAYSAYGYGGFWGDCSLLPDDVAALRRFLAGEGIVALFIRHAPFLGNHAVLPGDMTELNRRTYMAALNPSPSFDAFLQSLHQKLRWSVKTALKAGAAVRFAAGQEIAPGRLAEFHELYAGQMNEKGASDYLVFSERFFQEQVGTLGKACEFASLRTQDDGPMLAGAFFLVDHNGLVHYHLSAAREEAKKGQMMELLMASALHRYGNAGYRALHLGGGHALDESDGLSRFKRKFATERLDFHCTKLICDEARYRRLREAQPLRHPGFFLIHDARGE